jgi:triosephosphate isomerase
MKKPDVDGFLVGGASLKAKEFITILNSPKGAGRL